MWLMQRYSVGRLNTIHRVILAIDFLSRVLTPYLESIIETNFRSRFFNSIFFLSRACFTESPRSCQHSPILK